MGRCATVDGLRGIAAMLVVAYHLSGNLAGSVGLWAPELAQLIFKYGFLGVQIFFVLSGYAIASSLSNSRVNGRYLVAFALRRSIRLDPAYWISIATALAIAATASLLFGISRDMPSPGNLIAHLLYLQNIIGYKDIVPIYWTLCLEIQFYLALLVSVLLLQRFFGTNQVQYIVRRQRTAGILLLSAGVSVAMYANYLPQIHPGLFLQFWFFFVLGSCVFWVTQGWLRHPTFWAVVSIVALIGLSEKTVHVFSGIATALLLYVVLMANLGSTFMAGAIFQWLGKISYSLYLFHPTVGWSFISLAKRMMGMDLGPLESGGTFVAGIGVSIATAWIAFRLIERPSHRLSRSVTLDKPLDRENKAAKREEPS